jgi:predicted amidohydrolase YtcJ
MDARGVLQNRVNVMAIRRPDGGTDTLPLPERHVSDFLRVDTIKFFADGGLSGATAALSMNYRHADHRGVKRFERDELFDLARDAHLNGLRIGTHAIGDVTIDMMLDVYESLAELGPGARHRIEHFGLPDDAQCVRAAKLGVMVTPQPIFLYSLGRNFRQYLPDELLRRG